MRIAILTFHRAANCGAVLQAWALQTVLRQMGHEVVKRALLDVRRSKPYLYVYTIHASDELLALAREVSRRRGLDLVVQVSTPVDRDDARPDGVYETDVTPDRMVASIAGASCVIAASFHGTALSLIFGKPLVSVGNFTFMKLGRRQRELLASVGLEDRMITVEDDPGRVAELLSQDLPREALGRLAEIRRHSQGWLETAVGKV